MFMSRAPATAHFTGSGALIRAAALRPILLYNSIVEQLSGKDQV